MPWPVCGIESQKLVEQTAPVAEVDERILAAAKRLQQYEIVGYGCVCAYAKAPRLPRGGELLSRTLSEENKGYENLMEIKSGRQAPRLAPAESRQFWKRFLDLTCLFVALPFLLPVMGLIGLLIKIVSRDRSSSNRSEVGYRGGVFNVTNTGSMRVTSDEAVHRRHVRTITLLRICQ